MIFTHFLDLVIRRPRSSYLLSFKYLRSTDSYKGLHWKLPKYLSWVIIGLNHLAYTFLLIIVRFRHYQLFAHGRWFSPGSRASSTIKTGRHDTAEILLKVEINTKNQAIKQAIDRTMISQEVRGLLCSSEK
jgi:hypothetical protein